MIHRYLYSNCYLYSIWIDNVFECVGLIKSKIYNIISSKCWENVGMFEIITIKRAIKGKSEKIVKKLKLAA